MSAAFIGLDPAKCIVGTDLEACMMIVTIVQTIIMQVTHAVVSHAAEELR
jgi:hypothetical protein